jgi:peptidoglycan/LPS O-acetylase OafA/YrhL
MRAAERLLDAIRARVAAVPTIGSRYNRRSNSFTALRLLLAVMVLYAHDWAIIGSPDRDQLYRVTGGAFTFGLLAVYCFFVLSGFLVTQSLESTRSPRRILSYLRKRMLRIWPALAGTTLLFAFVLGAVLTRRPLASYYSFEGGWSPWWYSFDTLTFNVFSNLFGWHTRVRDVFAGLPMNATANGSLWSLRFEFSMYLLLGGLAVVAAYRLRALAALSATSAYLGLILLGAFHVAIPHPDVWVFHEWGIFITVATYFFLGSALYAFRDHVPTSTGAAILLSIAALFTSVMSIGWAIAPIVIAYVVVVAGISPRFSWYGARFGDYSYGTYLIAWPVQQTVMALVAPKSPYVLFAVALPVTLLLAVASWHFVEGPALRLKGRASPPSAPLSTNASATSSVPGAG